MELSAIEHQHRADATTPLIEELRAGRPGYWNHPQVLLGGRTPTEALADGDEAAVRELIAQAYRASEEGAERHRLDPEFQKMLRERSSLIRPA